MILRKNSGIPKIGDKKSAHPARFPSSPINRSPNSVFSDYRQIRIIRTHRNSSESPNSVIRVTRITEHPNNRSFGYSCHQNNRIFGCSVIPVTRITKFGDSAIRRTPKKPNLAIIAQNRWGASRKNGISFEGITIFLEKISAKTPNPELLKYPSEMIMSSH